MLVAVVQKSLGDHLTESYFDCKHRWGLNDNVSELPVVLTNDILLSVCIGVVTHHLLSVYLNSPADPTSPAPRAIVPLGLAVFSLTLGANVIVTTLIAGRIWYLSPRKACKIGSVKFPTGIGRTAIDIVIESGMLYLVAQLILAILFTTRNPAQCIAAVIAVQIYVRIPHSWEAENSLWTSYLQKTHRASHRRWLSSGLVFVWSLDRFAVLLNHQCTLRSPVSLRHRRKCVSTRNPAAGFPPRCPCLKSNLSQAVKIWAWIRAPWKVLPLSRCDLGRWWLDSGQSFGYSAPRWRRCKRPVDTVVAVVLRFFMEKCWYDKNYVL